MKTKIILMIILTVMLIAPNVNALTKYDCLISQKPLHTSNVKLKLLFNYVLFSYEKTCEAYYKNKQNVCNIKDKDIEQLKTDTNKLNYLIDRTYYEIIKNYNQCNIKNELNNINKLRNIDFYTLKYKVNDCYNKIKKDKLDTCNF